VDTFLGVGLDGEELTMPVTDGAVSTIAQDEVHPPCPFFCLDSMDQEDRCMLIVEH